VAVDNYALVVAGVLRTRLNHLHGVVLQVEVDAHVADAVLLGGTLHHRLLEVGVEAEDLLVEGHPGGLVGALALRVHGVLGAQVLAGQGHAADAGLVLADHHLRAVAVVEVVREVVLVLAYFAVERVAGKEWKRHFQAGFIAFVVLQFSSIFLLVILVVILFRIK